MNISIKTLKRLIQEVIRESEEPGTEDTSDFSKNSSAAKKKADEIEVKLTVSGVKPGGAVKKFLAKLAAGAIQQDYKVLRADMEKSGVKVATLSPDDLVSISKQAGKPNIQSPEKPLDNPEDDKKTEMPSRAQWKTMSPEQRDKYVQANSHEQEWKDATEKDMEDTRKKTKAKAAAIAAGTYDPEDTSLWTDKEWDAWNSGEDTTKTYDSGKSAGKYKPNLGKGTAHTKKGAVAADFTSKLRHE